MTRTSLQRKKPMSRCSVPLRRTAMKKRRPKKRAGHDKKMLHACRGAPCYLEVPDVCLREGGRDTVVPCHSNQAQHGKGMGLKADDQYTVPGCLACHQWLDQGSAEKRLKQAIFNMALRRWARARDAGEV